MAKTPTKRPRKVEDGATGTAVIRGAVDTKRDRSKESVLEEARQRAVYAYDQWLPNFDEMRKELHFLMGHQWPAEAAKERRSRKRPLLTLNTLPAFVDQVLGDQRQNTPAIHISPADNLNTKFMTAGKSPKQIDQAEVFEGIIREIEYESRAHVHYDQAGQHAAECGLGWLRVFAEWKDNDSFEQDLRIKSHRDRLNVLIDPDAKEFDYSDANYAFIPEQMPRLEFEKRWPNARIGDVGKVNRWWGTADKNITVTEYYRREPYQDRLYLLSSQQVMWKAQWEEAESGMRAEGIEVIAERSVTRWKVWWSLITAWDELEGPKEWPGSTIPLVPVFGKHVDGPDGTVYRGLTRFARDAKQAHNYWMTAATERVASIPRAPFMLTPEMIAGHQDQWDNFNTRNDAYLLFNQANDDGPIAFPKREPPPPVPVAELQMAMSMRDLEKSTIGMFDAALGAQSNETSGRAIMARQRESDVANFAFSDNQDRAIERIAQILVEVIPHIYNNTRRLNMRGKDRESTTEIVVNEVAQAEDGSDVLVNDLSQGRFTVRCKSGPAYTTLREESSAAWVELSQANPNIVTTHGDIMFSSMDWPDADIAAKRFKKMMDPKLLEKEELQELWGDEGPPEQAPTPEQQAEMKKSEAEMAKAQAMIADAKAREAEAALKMREVELAAATMGQGDMAEVIKNIVAEGVATAIAMLSQPGANGGAPPPATTATTEGAPNA